MDLLINREIVRLGLDEGEEVPEGEAIPVCDATVAEWDEFVENGLQALRSTQMEWVDGRVFMVEFLPSVEHAAFCSAFTKMFVPNDVVRAHLRGYMASFIWTATPKLEPDLSYGPLKASLPAGLNRHWEWHTVKVEVGVSRRWGNFDGQLDWKANRWASCVCVRYILCVAIGKNLSRAEFKLYRVDRLGGALPEQVPIPVEAPRTLVSLNSRLVLGLQPRDVLPVGFPDPLTLDLYQVLLEARRCQQTIEDDTKMDIE